MPIINAFNRQDAKTLPPHKKGIDHEINFVEGKTNDDVLAMPLYQMSKDQLLVLRKTLTELLDNGLFELVIRLKQLLLSLLRSLVEDCGFALIIVG